MMARAVNFGCFKQFEVGIDKLLSGAYQNYLFGYASCQKRVKNANPDAIPGKKILLKVS